VTIIATSVNNVTYSMNAWLAGKITAYPLPFCLTTMPTWVTDFPEDIAGAVPVFSIIHIPIDSVSPWEGKRAENGVGAAMNTAFMEVDAWVSRSDSRWAAQLEAMQSIIESAVKGTTTVVILDFVSNQANPTATSYRIMVGDMTASATEPDPNADVRRRRMLIKYSWVYRS
jgi:hypothetical protein